MFLFFRMVVDSFKILKLRYRRNTCVLDVLNWRMFIFKSLKLLCLGVVIHAAPVQVAFELFVCYMNIRWRRPSRDVGFGYEEQCSAHF